MCTVFIICYTLASLTADYVPAIATAITFTNFATTDNEFHDRIRGCWLVRENRNILIIFENPTQLRCIKYCRTGVLNLFHSTEHLNKLSSLGNTTVGHCLTTVVSLRENYD